MTNIVNGASRLQPVILQVGQAAGVMAAMCVKNGISPKQLNVRADIQWGIMEIAYSHENKVFLVPCNDVEMDAEHFSYLQRAGITGILRGKGEPYQWANRTWFYPGSLVRTDEVIAGMASFAPGFQVDAGKYGQYLTIEGAIELIWCLENAWSPEEFHDLGEFKAYAIENKLTYLLEGKPLNHQLTRLEMAYLLSKYSLYAHPEIDFEGKALPGT